MHTSLAVGALALALGSTAVHPAATTAPPTDGAARPAAALPQAAPFALARSATVARENDPGVTTPPELRIAPDGTFALLGQHHTLQRIALGAGRMRVVAKSRKAGGNAVVIAPSGRLAYVTRTDRARAYTQRLKVVDLTRPGLPVVATFTGSAFMPGDDADDIDVSRDGRWLYAKGNDGLTVFSLTDPRRPRKVRLVKADEQWQEMVVTRDGRRLLSLSYDPSTERQWVNVYSLESPGRPRVVATRALRLDAEASSIAADRADGSAYVVGEGGSTSSIEDGEFVEIRASDGAIRRQVVRNRDFGNIVDAALWPDGRHLLPAGYANVPGRDRRAVHPHPATRGAFHPLRRRHARRRLDGRADPRPGLSGRSLGVAQRAGRDRAALSVTGAAHPGGWVRTQSSTRSGISVVGSAALASAWAVRRAGRGRSTRPSRVR